MTKKVMWGILGSGMIARTFAQALPLSRTGELLAVASRSQAQAERLAQELSVPRAYGSYEELLADADVDVVYIALPNHLHREWTIRCAEQGKHILCEKPLATNYGEAMVMVEAAREHDVFLMEGFMYRCHPQTARLQELVREGAVGEVRQIEARFSYKMGQALENIRLQNATAGGGIMDVGCYCTSMVRLLAGAALGQEFADPVEVKGHAHLGVKSRVDEWATAILRFPKDILATVTCGTEVDIESAVHIWGSEGYISVPNPWFPGRNGGSERILVQRSGQAEAEEVAVPTEVQLYAAEADVVAAHLHARQASSPCMTWADSLGNMQVLDDWRQQVGLVFDSERLEALTQPYSGRPLGPRPNNRMAYGRVADLEKPVSRVVLGSMVLDNGRAPFSFAMLDYFFEQGGNCIDTAWVYGGGTCEMAVGDWMARRGTREQVVLIGKGACTTDCTTELVTKELFESLDRLQTDYMDIYFMHRDNPRIPAGEFVECLNEHLRTGRIRAFGGSNWTPGRIAQANAYAAAHNLVGFAASSPNFSLALWNEPTWSDCVTASDLPTRRWYEEHDIALFAWSSQAGGFFTGRFKPEDRDDPDAADLVRVWFNEDNFRRLERAKELADRKGVTPTQIALAYVLCQPINIYALIGPRTIEEMRTSLLSLEVKPTPEELRYLNLEEA